MKIIRLLTFDLIKVKNFYPAHISLRLTIVLYMLVFFPSVSFLVYCQSTEPVVIQNEDLRKEVRKKLNMGSRRKVESVTRNEIRIEPQ